jgi:aminoglycoside 6'-N-acetyltransferase I
MNAIPEVRSLTAKDVELLANADPDVFDDPVIPASAAEFLADPRHHIAVAIADGVIVGFASAVCYVHPDKPAPEFWINEVGVAESHRGQGLAKQIMACLLDKARQLGCAEAWVLTEHDNTAAKRLYQSAGGIEAPNNVVMFEFRLSD